MRLNALLTALTGVLSAFFLTSCVTPEKITATYTIHPDGVYVFSYHGTIVNIPARTVQLGLSAMEVDDAPPSEPSFEEKIERIKLSVQNDPRTKSFQRQSDDTYSVKMEETGNIKEEIISYFYSQELYFSSISFNKRDNTAIILIKNVDNESIDIIKKLNVKIEGEVKVSTNCEIISSTANIEKSLFGNLYVIKIEENLLREGAEIVIQLS